MKKPPKKLTNSELWDLAGRLCNRALQQEKVAGRILAFTPHGLDCHAAAAELYRLAGERVKSEVTP